MSFQEDSVIFKQKLYQNFKQAGLVSRLQTTLRANLLQKIQKPGKLPSPQQQKQEKIQAAKPFHLKKKFIQNIVTDYLQKKNMEYTLSIFLPECNLEEKDVVKANVMAEIINFPLANRDIESQSLLECLVDEWAKRYCNDRRQRSVQTQLEGQPVEKKLQKIEKDYFAKIDYWKLIPNRQVSDNPTLFQHQQKLRAQFQVEKQKVKLDTERIIKAQMQRTFQSQYEFRLNQISKQHQKRISELKMRQKQIMESLERKKTQLEQKAKELSTKEFQLIKKYETREKEILAYYKKREADIQNREKEFWKKELQLKAKKREYQDVIRTVKQKAINEAAEMPQPENWNQTNTWNSPGSNTMYGKSSFYQ